MAIKIISARRFSYDLLRIISPFLFGKCFLPYSFPSVVVSTPYSFFAGVTKIFLIYSRLGSALSLNLLRRIATFSSIEPIVILSRRGLPDPFLPSLTALVMVGLTLM